MKQNLRFILLTLLCAVVTGAWGDELTATLQYSGSTTTNMTGENDAALLGLNANKWSVVGAKGSHDNLPGLNKDGDIRLYYHENGGNTLTVKSLDEEEIKSISITFTGTNYSKAYVSVEGEKVTGDNGVYTINSTEFVIGNANTSSVQVRISKIDITYEGDAAAVATPTISPDGGNFIESANLVVTLKCATEGASIYYTTDGTTPDNTSTSYTRAFSLNKPANSNTVTVKAIAYNTTGDKSEIASATFNYISFATIAQVREQQNGSYVYTQGTVTSISTKNDYKTIYVQDATAGICVYAKTEACGIVDVGNVVDIYGTLSTYHGLLEITDADFMIYGSQTVEPVVKTIAEIKSDYSGDNKLQGILVSIEEARVTKIDGQKTTIQQGNETIEVIGISDVEYSVGDFLTLTGNVGCYDGAQIVHPTNVIVKKGEEPKADLPFEFDGGSADIENTDGLTQEGLGSDYKNKPYLKFDGEGDWVLLQFNERPGILSFDIQGNNFSGGTFTVQTSEDGVTFTDLETYTELGSTQTKDIKNLDENVRYIKWVYTVKSSGNVALGNIKLAKYVEPTEYVLTISDVENVTITAADEEGNAINNGDEVMEGTKVILTVTANEGYEVESVSVTDEEDAEVKVTKNETDGTWSFTMPSSDAMVTCIVNKAEEPSDEIWVKTDLAKLTSDDVFVIVGDNGTTYAMSNDKGTSSAPQAIGVTINDNKITSKVADNIKWNISGNAEDGYTFYPNGNEKAWLYTTNTNNGVRVGTNDSKVFTINNGYLYNTKTSRFVGIYNSQDWRCYTLSQSGDFPSNIKEQSFAFYKLVEPITLTISSVGYATLYYGDRDLVVPEGVTANTYKLNAAGDNVEILKTFNAGDVIPADCGVVLEADEKDKAQEFTFEVSKANVESLEGNLLYGLDEEGQTVGPDGTTDYIFYMLSLDKNGENVGFYWKNGGAPFTAKAHKAYLAIPKSSDINISAFSFDDLNGIKGIESDSIVENGEIYTLSGIRMNGKQLPKGIYIVNGKKVVIK